MRKSTLLWLILATFCGTALFHTSQKVHDERRQLAKLDSSIAHEKESIRVLTAEWGYLNNPHRLETLAKTYLHMTPLSGSQFIRIKDIPLRPATPAAMPRQVAQKKSAARTKIPHRLAAVEHPVTIKIRKPAASNYFKRKSKPQETGMTTARNFSDVMKSLRLGVE